jgi:hypothetical protein
MDLLEIGLNVVHWIGLAQERYRWRALVKAVTPIYRYIAIDTKYRKMSLAQNLFDMFFPQKHEQCA